MAETGKFASDNFFHICEARGMGREAATKQIRTLLQQGVIEHAGYRQRQGIRGLPLYKVKDGASIKPAPEPKPRRERKEPAKLKGSADKYYYELSEKESEDRACADRLEAAMSKWR